MIGLLNLRRKVRALEGEVSAVEAVLAVCRMSRDYNRQLADKTERELKVVTRQRDALRVGLEQIVRMGSVQTGASGYEEHATRDPLRESFAEIASEALAAANSGEMPGYDAEHARPEGERTGDTSTVETAFGAPSEID